MVPVASVFRGNAARVVGRHARPQQLTAAQTLGHSRLLAGEQHGFTAGDHVFFYGGESLIRGHHPGEARERGDVERVQRELVLLL